MMQCTSGGVLFDVISSCRRQQVSVGLHERLASQGQLTALLSSSLGTAKQEAYALALYSCKNHYRLLDLTKTPFELGLTVPGSPWEVHVMISADSRVCLDLPFFITINSQDSQIEGKESEVGCSTYFDSHDSNNFVDLDTGTVCSDDIFQSSYTLSQTSATRLRVREGEEKNWQHREVDRLDCQDSPTDCLKSSERYSSSSPAVVPAGQASTASLVQGDRASSEVASRGDTSDNGKTLKETVDAELREFRGESRSSLTSADVQETVVHERLLHDKRFASSLPNVMADVQQARPMDRAVLVSGYGDAEMGDAKDSGIENVASKDKGSQHHFSSSSGINPDTTASVWPLTMEGAMDSNIIPRNDPQSQDSISVTDDEDPQSFAAGEGKCRSYICFDVW
jgi:hypothetical protein